MALALQKRSAAPRSCPHNNYLTSQIPKRPRVAVTARAASLKKGGAGFIPIWKDVYTYLKGKNLQTVTPNEAKELIAAGKWTLVDVRRPDQYEKSHPEGSVNVPMYQLLDKSKMDATRLLKTVFYAFNGVTAIESNENFIEDAKKVIGGGTGVIFCCDAGGTMQASVNFPTGKPSRSLQACYKVLEGGLTDQVAHLERGVFGWYKAELPMVGEYEPELGRSPMAADAPVVQNQDQKKGEKKGWFF